MHSRPLMLAFLLAAAPTLLGSLDQDLARAPLLGWLEKGDRWQKQTTVRELNRAADASRLGFAHGALRLIAVDASLDEGVRMQARALLK